MPNIYEEGAANKEAMGSQTGTACGSQPVSILQAILALEYIIRIYYIYPSRN